jgi:hypothetical protein
MTVYTFHKLKKNNMILILYMEVSNIQNNTILLWNNSKNIAELTFFSGIGSAFSSAFSNFTPSRIGNSSFRGTYVQPAIINRNNPNYGNNLRDVATAFAIANSTLGRGSPGDAYMRAVMRG